MSRRLTEHIETAGQHAYRQIRERILSGELRSGERLNQRQLAHGLGMSRIPVRDALRLLAADGLVDVKAHTTATVTPLSRDDLRELYELRVALEPMLCRLALAHVDREDIAAMAGEMAAMDGAASADDWQLANNAFHARLYRRSERPRTIEIIARTRQQTDRYTRLHLAVHRAGAAVEHRLILDAVRAGQVDRLESLVRAHISAGYETILRRLGTGTLQMTAESSPPLPDVPPGLTAAVAGD